MLCWPSPAGSTARIGGPPMPGLTGAGANRRTLYGFIDRLNLPGLYRTFDFPDPNATSPRRDQTTVAPQALFLMNHPFVIAAAGDPDPAGDRRPATDCQRWKADRTDLRPAASPEDLAAVQEYLGNAPIEPAAPGDARPALLMLTSSCLSTDHDVTRIGMS